MGKAVARRASALRRLRTTPPPPHHPKKKDVQGVKGGVEARGRRGTLPPSAGARRPSPVIDRSRGTSASPPRRRRGARAGTGARWRIVHVAPAPGRRTRDPVACSSSRQSIRALRAALYRHRRHRHCDTGRRSALIARSLPACEPDQHTYFSRAFLSRLRITSTRQARRRGGEETGARAGRQHGTQVRLAPRECAHRREHARRRLSRTFSGRGKW